MRSGVIFKLLTPPGLAQAVPRAFSFMKDKPKSKKEGVIVLVDGSNLYHRLKELGVEKKIFDYTSFADWLAGGRKVLAKEFHSGKIRTDPRNKRGVKLMADQQRLFTRLQKGGWEIHPGYLLKIGNRYHEKG